MSAHFFKVRNKRTREYLRNNAMFSKHGKAYVSLAAAKCAVTNYRHYTAWDDKFVPLEIVYFEAKEIGAEDAQ